MSAQRVTTLSLVVAVLSTLALVVRVRNERAFLEALVEHQRQRVERAS